MYDHARRHPLAAVLINYLRLHHGATTRYDHIGGDAHWSAATKTLTLRADADPLTQLEIIRDFIGMCEPLSYPSRLGAATHRNLRAVAAG